MQKLNAPQEPFFTCVAGFHQGQTTQPDKGDGNLSRDPFQILALAFFSFFLSFFPICRCKNSVIPRAMSLLGSQNSAQVASWDVIFCSLSRGRCGRTNRSKLGPFSLLLFSSSRRVCDSQAGSTIYEAALLHTGNRTWCSALVSRSLIWLLFMQQNKKS